MTGWADLAAAALLGTERREVDVAALPGPLGAAAARSAAADPAARLLDAAALATPYRRAGIRPAAPDTGLRRAAGPETARLVRPAAAGHLARVLTMPPDLLVEWAAAAVAGGWRPPAELLPDLLDTAARDPRLAAAVVPLLGVRGHWLAAAREDWTEVVRTTGPSPAAAPDPGEVWEQGEKGERRAVFAALRASDPDRARALLAAGWRGETGEDREWFLDQVGAAPTPADEPQLETALDDRRQGVRSRAVAALARLPHSAYAGRMAARARAAVSVERRLMRTRLAVVPPAECTAAMVRDGIRATPPTGTGAQAWWLRQVVAAAPLRVWADLGTPAELLGWTGDWTDVLTGGWQDAALRQRDAGWAAALLDRDPADRDLAGLVGVLPADRRPAAVVRLLRGSGGPRPWLVPTLLETCPAPWPDGLAEAALARIVRPDAGPRDAGARDVLALLAARLPPERAPAVRDRAARLQGHDWAPALAAVADLLDFRHTMLEELR